MQRIFLSVVAVLISVLIAGCGGGKTDRSDTSATVADLESFGHLKVPASAQNVKVKSQQGMDKAIAATLDFAPADLAKFQADSRVSPLKDGFDPFAGSDPMNSGIARSSKDKLAGVEDKYDAVYRNFLIDKFSADRWRMTVQVFNT